MRYPTGFGATALVAVCVVEVVSLIAIAVAAANAPLVSADVESTPDERLDRAAHHQRSPDGAMREPRRLVQ